MFVFGRRSSCARNHGGEHCFAPFLFGGNLIECECMETKTFRLRYRIKTARIPNWNYASPGLYFVTMCTRSRIEWFGCVENGKMVLSPIGETADACWREIAKHFPFVVLDEWVVMPNHVHGVLRIMDGRGVFRNCMDVNCSDAICRDAICRDANIRVSTNCVSTNRVTTIHVHAITENTPSVHDTQNPMNMIRHHHPFIQYHKGKMFRNFPPTCIRRFADRR